MKKSMLTAALVAMLIAMMLSVPATAQEEEPFTDTLSSKAMGLGKTYDLSQYPLQTVDGTASGTMADFGKYIYVDVWATWCGPCIREMPNLKASQDALGGDDFTIISLSVDNTAEPLEKWLNENETHYPMFYDPENWKGKFATDFEIHSIPSLFLFNPDGVLIGRNIRGEQMPELLKAAMENGTEGLRDSQLEIKFDIDRATFAEKMVKQPFDYEYRGKQDSREFWITAQPLEAEVSFELILGEIPSDRELHLKLYSSDFPGYIESINNDSELEAFEDVLVNGDQISHSFTLPADTYTCIAEAVLIDPANPDEEESVKTLWATLGGLGVRSK